MNNKQDIKLMKQGQPASEPEALRAISFVVLVASMAALVVATPNLSAAEPMRGVSVDDWQGWMIMAGGKGYATTPMGQLHYRDVGPRDYQSPIVLMHQSPMSMIQFAGVQNALVDMGVRSIAVDSPGYGMSDLPSKQPMIQDYADNIVHLLDHLKLDKVVIAGHHTGSSIAASFAAKHPNRTAAVILHGITLWTKERAEASLNRERTPRTPVADGSHLTGSFRVLSQPPRQAILDARTLLAMSYYIQGPDIGHYAAYKYDVEPDLRAISVPGLILSDVQDGIHELDLKAARLRPDFKYVEFSKGNMLEFMAEPHRWARIVADFMDSIETQQDIPNLAR